MDTLLIDRSIDQSMNDFQSIFRLIVDINTKLHDVSVSVFMTLNLHTIPFYNLPEVKFGRSISTDPLAIIYEELQIIYYINSLNWPKTLFGRLLKHPAKVFRVNLST